MNTNIQSNVPKLRARVVASSSIRPVRMTEQADRAIADVQAALQPFGQVSVSMIVRRALEQYVFRVQSLTDMKGEWVQLTHKCHVTRDK
jgi:hypothetical protein